MILLSQFVSAVLAALFCFFVVVFNAFCSE